MEWVRCHHIVLMDRPFGRGPYSWPEECESTTKQDGLGQRNSDRPLHAASEMESCRESTGTMLEAAGFPSTRSYHESVVASSEARYKPCSEPSRQGFLSRSSLDLAERCGISGSDPLETPIISSQKHSDDSRTSENYFSRVQEQKLNRGCISAGTRNDTYRGVDLT